jgi:hypothetical protein
VWAETGAGTQRSGEEAAAMAREPEMTSGTRGFLACGRRSQAPPFRSSERAPPPEERVNESEETEKPDATRDGELTELTCVYETRSVE